MATVGWALIVLLQVAMFVLLARIVISWIEFFARGWQATGITAVVFEIIYSLTDPPLKAIGKVVKPIQAGQMALDLAPMILLIGLYLLQAVVAMVFY